MYRQKMMKYRRCLNAPEVGCWRNWLAGLVLAFSIMSGQSQISLNVKNFGAVGDAVQFYANTVRNSAVITTTNQLSSADIGKAIEVFGCGAVTVAPNCEDMVTTIENVVNGTNIYLGQICQRTLTNTFATYGTDNSASFTTAIQAAVSSGTNVTVNVPAGKYLCLADYVPSAFAYLSIPIYGGGFHLVGAGMTNTVLLGQGAWTMQSGAATRGFLLAIVPSITNNYPVSFENMTLDGGVEHGNTPGNSYFPASPVDGGGWDLSHDAIDIRGLPGQTFNQWIWTNILVTHWRGEEVKSNDTSSNGHLTMVNCVFADGNATAINIYPTLMITNCVFTNLHQIAEYYQAYSTGTCYFVHNYVTNITGNGFALNGGKGNNPNFIIQGNIFDTISGDGVLTVPADNVFITSNVFANVNFPVVTGAAGYQGTYCNSNIVISGNLFTNASTVLQLGGTSQSDPNRTVDVRFFGNNIMGRSDNGAVNIGGGGMGDVLVYSNSVTTMNDGINGNNRAQFTSGGAGSMFALVDVNNLYWTPMYDLSGKTNFFSYANGSKFQVVYKYHAGTVYALTDTNGAQISIGAQMMIWNTTQDNGEGTTFPLYLNSKLTGIPLMVVGGEKVLVRWNGSKWILPSTSLAPPLNFKAFNTASP
jgi:hypothetical protein